MNFAQTVFLGAIAGFTIFLGLPMGRMKIVSTRARTMLTMISSGILFFLFFDIFGNVAAPIENTLSNVLQGKTAVGELVLYLALMVLVGATRQDAAVNFRMQRLHPSIEHLGRAGEILDCSDFHPGRFQSRRGASGRDYFDAVPREHSGKIRKTSLVGDANQRASDHDPFALHRRLAPNDAWHSFTDRAKHLIREWA